MMRGKRTDRLTKRRTTRWWFAVLLAGLCLTNPPSLLNAHEGHEALPSTGAKVEGNRLWISEGAGKAIGLAVAPVTLENLHQVLHVNARVEVPWEQQAVVSLLMSGRIEGIAVQPGEIVESGQELARITSQELETLQLELLQANSELDLTAKRLELREKLSEKGGLSRKQHLEARYEHRQAQSRLKTAIGHLRAIGVDPEVIDEVRRNGHPIRSLAINSPIDGIVTRVHARQGQVVDTLQPLVDIVDRSQLQIVGEVLETDAHRIEAGLWTETAILGSDEQPVEGEIAWTRIGINRERQTLDVVVPVENSTGKLRPGLFGRMQIRVRTSEEAVVCPVDALIERGARTFVLVRQRRSEYELREVSVGMRQGDRVEILDGLFPGDPVMVVATQLLASLFHDPEHGTIANRNRPGNDREAISRPIPTQPAMQFEGIVVVPTGSKSFGNSGIRGQILEIHVQPGQKVRAGQRLAEIDSRQLRSWQLELQQTEERLRWTNETLERLDELVKVGIVAPSELWQWEADRKSLQLTIDSLRYQLSLLGLSDQQIDRFRSRSGEASSDSPEFLTVPIRAPADGRLADFDVVPGQVVDAGQNLFEIHNLDRIWVEGYVFVEGDPLVEPGWTAEVQFPAFPEQSVIGTIVRIAPELSQQTRVLPVWIEMPNPDGRLQEGMLARVTAKRPADTEVLERRPSQ